MKKLIIYTFLLLTFPTSILAQSKTIGTTGADYSTLNEAFFDINNGILIEAITLQIIDNITESGTAELFESGYGGTSSYTSVTIYPTGSYTIDGDIDGPLISLNGASNVTINGRVNQSGAKGLTLTNMSTGTLASTIQLTESAANNTVEYCIIKGSETAATGGVIFFSSETIPPGSGNSNNIIDHNDITSYYDGITLTRPINAIYSSGTSGQENNGNIISNNSIYDFFTPSLSANGTSNGINISTNSSAWTISGNSFYESTSFAPSGTPAVTYNAIQINNPSGAGFVVTGNFIGGSSASGGGTWTKTNAKTNIFYAIYLNVGNGTASSVQNNTIKNFAWSNFGAGSWTGIHVAGGNVNVGTSSGNTLGAPGGTGSITVTGGANNTIVYGINIAGTGTVDCRNNIIGAITTSNGPGNSSNFFGINKTATAGTTTINNNTIGSLTQTNSIYTSSVSTSNAQSVYGISNAGTGNVIIGSNTIANLTNGTTNSTIGTAGLINGIKSAGGTNTITNNTIRDLTISNENTSTNNTASVCGIALTGATLKTVAGNIIYNLKNTSNSFAGSVIGLYFIGNTGANTVSENFIHSLSVTGASSTSASIYGIQIGAGAATYSNNIVSLGGNTQTTIYGLYETGAAGNNNNLYFNAVYINGVPTSGAGNSYALFSAVTTNTRNFRNNIFMNARSNSGATGKHYAAYFNYSTDASLTCNYNDYYVSGTGAVLGYYGADKAALPVVTTQDVNSLAINPVFVNEGGTSGTDYLPSASLAGVAGTGILLDYNGATRGFPPSIGAFEIGCANPASGGTIAADQIGCNPFDPAAFTNIVGPSGYLGTIEYKWQQSVTSDVSGFSDIPGSNSSTYNPGSLTQNTWFKRVARVSCTSWTGAAESYVVNVTLNSPPTANPITGGNALCMGGSLSLTSNATGTGTLTYTWASSDIGIATVSNSGIVTPVSASSANITYTVTDGNTCQATSANHAVTVNAPPAIGLVAGGTGIICSGTSTNITVALSETGTNYQLRNDNANELVGSVVPGNGGTINLPTGNLTFNTQFNVLATNTITSCSAELTEKEIVSTDPPSVGGSISGTSPVTYGSSTGTMTLTGYTGIIQRWEKRFNSGSWTVISNTNATYSETASSAGTWGYRAVVKSGSCAETNSAEFSITVNKAALTITADNKSKNYGASLPVLTVTYSGLVNGDVASATLPTISTTATAASPVGTYPITASGAADPNYNISYVAGTLSVDKVPLTITADNKSKNYGASLPVLTVTYSGLVNGDVASATLPTISTTATAASPVGTYPVMASGGSDNNYAFTYIDGVLSINKADQTVTFNVLPNKTYGDADFTATTSASSTLLVTLSSNNSAVATVVSGNIHIAGAGTTVIIASQPGNGNYNAATDVLQTLSVGKAGLTFTADNKSKEYQAQNPVLTYTVSGYVNSESQSVLDVLPTLQTTAVQNSPEGSYPITVSGGSDNNYNYLYVPGILSITKISQTITFTGFPVRLLVEDVYTLVATSTSGLPVLFESMDASIASVSGDRLTGVSKGTVQIRAYHQGDLNYDPAETFATVEIYSTHRDIMHLFTPNNDGFNDLWELPDLAEWGKCDVKVYNRWGKLVFADANYNNLWDGTSDGAPLPEGPYYFIIKTENDGSVKGTVNIVR